MPDDPAAPDVSIDDFDLSLPAPPDHGHHDDQPGVFTAKASAPAWGRGWPNCEAGRMRRVSGGGVAVNIDHRVAELTGLLLAETAARGYRLDQSQTGAFVCRAIGGTSSASLHSFGVAIDINWRENEFSTNPRFTIPRWAIDLWKRYGWSWGGDWSGKKDTMHFERVDTPASAAAYLARYKADHSAPPPAPVPQPPEVHPVTGSPRVDIAWTPSGRGYIVLFADGGVANYGDAPAGLSTHGAQPKDVKAVALAVHPSGQGIAVLYEDGQVDTRNAPHLGEPTA